MKIDCLEVGAVDVLVFGAYGIYFDPDCQDAITVDEIHWFRTVRLFALRMLC